MTLTDLTATELSDRVRRRELTAESVTTAFLDRAEALDADLHSFNEIFRTHAVDQAKAVDAKIQSGLTGGALAGVPIAIKDNLLIRGEACTCSSKMLTGFKATYDATVIDRLRQADAVFIGRTNLDEFAMGSSTENSAFGRTSNPWDLERVPGGSSGGSAAAVAARLAPIALGSDTGGSIRQPASFCGVLGLKPTYGRVSRFGLIAFASSLDQIGPFARTAEDAARVMSVISGADDRDSTSVRQAVPDYASLLGQPLSGLRIGLPEEYFVEGLDVDVDHAVRESVEELKRLGASVQTIQLPHTPYCLAVYYILAPSEASSNLSRFDGVRYGFSARESTSLLDLYEKSRGEGFGPEVKRRIMLGTYSLSSGYYDAYYAKAQKVRTLIKQDFDRAFQSVDVIATPTCPTPAFKPGEKSSDPLQMYLSDIFTISCNLAGLPGVSIPCGMSKNALPIGLQLLGQPFDEGRLLAIAHRYQEKTQWHRASPALRSQAVVG